MLKRRIIPVVLLKNGFVVQSKGYARHKKIGNAHSAVKRLSEWGADELIYLNISATDVHDVNRDDLRHPTLASIEDVFEAVAGASNMPTTLGGGIRSFASIERCLRHGADKVAVNTLLQTDPAAVTRAAQEFGAQALVGSVDYRIVDGTAVVVVDRGSHQVDYGLVDWCKRATDLGCGELLLHAIDRDGMKVGYDVATIDLVEQNTSVPLVALGGAGEWEHFAQALASTRADALAAANIFHFSDQSVFVAKQYLHERGFRVRPPETMTL